eukprot:34251_1
MLRIPRLQQHVALQRLPTLSCRQVNTQSADPSKRHWDPTKIFPNEPGQVRVCGITMRDGHQSLNGGMHRIDLLEKAAFLFDAIRPPSMQYPGVEEIGGGTVVDFPLRFKGENPFRNMERISTHLRNTPASCLIRSDSLCGYNINPPDVVDAFITRYAQCGIDVFRVFDAYNNVENQRAVSRAVLKANKHYQAAITFTSHEDETLFNDGWVADMAEGFAKLGAHSICIKDMAGIASPYLMAKWVKAIKAAVPHLPIHIHSHYTTGFSPITYIQAIEAGASAIDCGISTLSGRSGHPAMEVFNQTLFDMGYDLGWDYKEALEAMKPIADLYREHHPAYEFCEMKMAGSVDYRVFTQGIPGGQISIMRNELVRNGYGHLFNNVIDQIQRVRTQVGGVALVTPTSEHVARQAIVNAMNGQPETTDGSPLWPGYSEMLRGVMGRPPSSPDPSLQKRALFEYTQSTIKGLALETDIDVADISTLVEFMWQFSEKVRNLRDAEDLEHRIDQLRRVDEGKYALQIGEAKDKLSKLSVATKEEDERYLAILKLTPDDATYKALVSGCGPIGSLVEGGSLSRAQFLEVIRASTMCTVCPSTVLADAMERSRNEIEEMAVAQEMSDIPQRGTIEFEEWSILQCMFKHAQNIALFWFKNNKENPEFWDKNFPSDFVFEDRAAAAPSAAIAENVTMYPYRTKVIEANDDPQVIEWSETELKRIFENDIETLNQLKKKLEKVKKGKEENENRTILKKRHLDKLNTEIHQLTAAIEQKLKTSIYNTQCHQAGYEIDVDQSIKTNKQKLMAFK